MPPSKIKVSDLVVQLALSLALSLRLARQGKVGEVILGALSVRTEQLRFLGVQEGEGLGARPVRLHTHLDSFNFRFTKQFRCLSKYERNTRGRCLLELEYGTDAPILNLNSNKNATDQNHEGSGRSNSVGDELPCAAQRVTFTLYLWVDEGKSSHSDLVSGCQNSSAEI